MNSTQKIFSKLLKTFAVEWHTYTYVVLYFCINPSQKENILHLDLACRNLLVAFEGSDSFSVKVSDFGLSKVTETGKFYGTQKSMFAVRWSSPEVIDKLKFTR